MNFVWRVIKLTLQCLWFLAIAIPIFQFLERPPVPQLYLKREIMNPDKKVAPGGTLIISIAAPMTKDCDGKVLRVITDSTGREFPFAIEPRPQREEYPVELTVPLGVFPGKAEYFATIYWSCNWVQQWFPKEIKQPPLEFEILPAEGQISNPAQQGIYEAPEQKSELAKTDR